MSEDRNDMASRAYRSSSQEGSDPLDLDALEKVARAASPGPWEIDGGTVLISTAPWPMEDGPGWHDWEAAGKPKGRFVAETRTHEAEGEANAEFIATFDPPTALRLIALARHTGQSAERPSEPREEHTDV